MYVDAADDDLPISHHQAVVRVQPVDPRGHGLVAEQRRVFGERLPMESESPLVGSVGRDEELLVFCVDRVAVADGNCS